MLLLGAVTLATLVANGLSQLRHMAAAFLAISLAANAIAASTASASQLAVAGCAGLVASVVLYVAARDGDYGEEPGWRLWLATALAAIATPIAFSAFRTERAEPGAIAIIGPADGVVTQLAAFWLLAAGLAVLVTARRAVRTALGALLMVTGLQLLIRLAPGPHLALTLLLAWLEVVVALTGAFLIVNERAVRE